MGAQQQQSDDKNSTHILWIIALIFMIGAIVWWKFAEELKQFFLWVRIAELQLIVWVVKPFNSSADVIYDLAFAKELTPDSLSSGGAKYLSEVMGQYLKYPVMLIFASLGYYIMMNHIKMRFRKKYDMSKLRKQELINWPQITPVSNLDIVSMDIDEGAWAMAMTPAIFARKYKVLKLAVAPVKPNSLPTDVSYTATVIKHRADRVFSRQLGSLWQGPQRLPMHRRALFAALVARGCRDSKTSRKLLEQISLSFRENSRGDYAGTQEILDKYYNNSDVQKVCESHAHVATVFISMLQFARLDGVLSTSDFIWLKPLDRRFWYIMNDTGRRTYTAESAGVFAHWAAEKMLMRPLTVPVVTEATNGLQVAIDEMIYVPTEEEKQELHG